MEDVITDYINSELSNRPEQRVTHDTPLIEAGILDSLSLLKLALFLERRFGTTVAAEAVTPENFATVDSIAAYLHSRQQEEARG